MKTKLFSPLSVTLFLCILFLGLTIALSPLGPMELVQVGTRYGEGIPDGTDGYDGQFFYFTALKWAPEQAAPHLDTPAYRYQRILLPALARLLSFGAPALVAWTLPLVNLAGHMLGVWAVSALLEEWKVNRWYALVYGLWVGFMLALRLDLPEPLAFGLAAAAVLAAKREKVGLSWVLYALALFAKETTIFFLAAQMAHDLLNKRWRRVVGLDAVSLAPFAVFQFWLYGAFGEFGINSGGNYATSFEIIPFMGIWRMGQFSIPLLLIVLVMYLPFVVWPAVWGLVQGARRWQSHGPELLTLGVLLNLMIYPFIPFSTYWATNGLFRFQSSMVLALLLFSAQTRHKKALRYMPLWLVLNAYLFNL